LAPRLVDALARMAFGDTPANRDALAQMTAEAPIAADPATATARVLQSAWEETAALFRI
jgi:hypothetical protein